MNDLVCLYPSSTGFFPPDSLPERDRLLLVSGERRTTCHFGLTTNYEVSVRGTRYYRQISCSDSDSDPGSGSDLSTPDTSYRTV